MNIGQSCKCLLFCLGLLPMGLQGQTTWEFWPEVDIWYRFAPNWRLSSFIPISRNLETNYREGSICLQVDYAWGNTRKFAIQRIQDEPRAQVMKARLGRVGWLQSRSLGDKGETYAENAALLELHVRNPLKGKVLVSHRLRSDLRWIGEDADFSARIRYRIMVEKEFTTGKWSLVPYVNTEAYYDTRYSAVNRWRFIGGCTTQFWRRMAVETNFTYQFDNQSSVRHLYAVNAIVHVFFEYKEKPR